VLDNTVTGTTLLIRSLFFTSSTTGYLAADGGIIRKTTDGGMTWTAQLNPYYGFFNARSMWFLDSNTGVITGQGGRILRTSDGGATWVTTYQVSTSEDVNDVEFTSSTTGYAVGNNGTILKTNDAGLGWYPADSSITTEDLISVDFASSTIGYACGSNGKAIKTTNGATGIEAVPALITAVNVYPNPFNSIATLDYTLEKDANVMIRITDLMGRAVFTGMEEQHAGQRTFEVSRYALQLANGIYMLQLITGNSSRTLKLVVN
jgi:photosystem II stability/assembly factor-like uncharacterized protein